ncbi:MAG: hypothetical protein ACHQEB_02055 [Chitinophagales bacterium]
MRKIIASFVNLFLFLSISSSCFSQTEIFDIATYTPPKDWKKDVNTGIVAYTNINTSTGTFCVIVMHACSASLGDAQKDFQMEWNDLVVTPHNADANPKTDIQTSPDGWKAVSSAAQIKIDSIDAFAILTVFSGFGKKFSVLTTLNDQAYVDGIDLFLKEIKLNKTGKIETVKTNTPDVTNTNERKGQFGSVMYTVPNGWKVTKYPDGDILSPVDLPQGEFLEVWVQPSLNFSGTMEQALQKIYDETATAMPATKMNDVNGGNYSMQPAKISFRGWEYIRCSGGVKMGSGDYPPEYGLDLFVIKVNGQFEKISIVKSRNNCSYSTYYPTSRLKYSNDIENFLFSLQFADWKEPVVKTGTAKGDGICGDWQGISMSVGLSKPGADLGAELKGKHLIFFSNGQALFVSDFPVEGLDDLNTWIKAENDRRNWGTYTFSNGRGVLKLPYADIPLRMENGKLIITTNQTDHGFIKTNSVDGARFNGTYTMSSKTALGTETGITPLISFTPDGKFADKGALKILSHSYVDCVNPANTSGSGTYEVKNYSVIFNYDDGRKLKLAFLGEGYDKSNQSPSTLTLSYYGNVVNKQ